MMTIRLLDYGLTYGNFQIQLAINASIYSRSHSHSHSKNNNVDVEVLDHSSLSHNNNG